MSESKIYSFGDNNNTASMMGMLAPLLQKNGIDPNTVMAMMNNRNGFGADGGWFIWVIFLFFLMGWGNFGANRNGANGDAGLANLINNDSGRELLLQAINGNQSAINQLASTLNCDVNQITGAINAVTNQICQMNGNIGQSTAQVVNTIQQSAMQTNQQLSSGFASIGFETQKQTCDIQNAINASTNQLLAGQRAAEMREMQRELVERDRTIAKQDVIINNGQQTAIFSQMIQQATLPIANALNVLQNDVNGIKCQLPKTVNLPCPDAVAVPACVAAQYGLGLGMGLGVNGVWG